MKLKSMPVTVCTHQHRPLIHTERRCPYCRLLDEYEQLVKRFKSIRGRIEEVKRDMHKWDSVIESQAEDPLISALAKARIRKKG
jgi:hypothetical protein